MSELLNMTFFKPHTHAELVALRAFPEGAIPESAYQKMLDSYNAITGLMIMRVNYKNDGLAMNGIMASPKTGKVKGLVVYNRGGSGNFGILTLHAIMRQFVPLARAGYMVIGSNYRGNDGGEGQDEFGGRDVDDVFALHEVISEIVEEPTPRYIIGHSRGGMMSYLMLKKGFPTKAAVAIAAVSDLSGWEHIRPEIYEKVYKRYIPNFATDEEAVLAERSVIRWPEKIKAPLLLLHGTGDDKVPHNQSEKLAAALKAIGSPHELVLYEGGNHALTRQWDDVTKRILDWLGSHV